jgi:serine/threonine protein phosphatase PrpC
MSSSSITPTTVVAVPHIEIGESHLESSKTDGSSLVFTTKSTFMREANITSKKVKITGRKRMRSIGVVPSSLDVIPETDPLNTFVAPREVTIVSVFHTLQIVDAEVMRTVAKVMHEKITGHINFTAIKNGPSILLDAFKAAEKFVANERDLRLSCTTAIISGDEVCMGHVGECRAVITDQHGRVISLIQDHQVGHALGNSSTPEIVHFQINILMPAITRSRSSSVIRRRSLSQYLSSLFTPKEELEIETLSGVVLVIANPGIWGSLDNEQASKKVQKYLDANNDDVNLAAKDLVQKVSNDLGPRSTLPLSASVIRWCLE